MPISDARREQNKLAQQRLRDKKQAEKVTGVPPTDLATQSAPERIDVRRTPKPITSVASSVPLREYVRAGQLAGYLEVMFRFGNSLGNDAAMRSWLDDHPVGDTVVLELLSVAGLSEPFRLWRASR
jgi:hypothetical protein